jgi:hypothetical protein
MKSRDVKITKDLQPDIDRHISNVKYKEGIAKISHKYELRQMRKIINRAFLDDIAEEIEVLLRRSGVTKPNNLGRVKLKFVYNPEGTEATYDVLTNTLSFNVDSFYRYWHRYKELKDDYRMGLFSDMDVNTYVSFVLKYLAVHEIWHSQGKVIFAVKDGVAKMDGGFLRRKFLFGNLHSSELIEESHDPLNEAMTDLLALITLVRTFKGGDASVSRNDIRFFIISYVHINKNYGYVYYLFTLLTIIEKVSQKEDVTEREVLMGFIKAYMDGEGLYDEEVEKMLKDAIGEKEFLELKITGTDSGTTRGVNEKRQLARMLLQRIDPQYSLVRLTKKLKEILESDILF